MSNRIQICDDPINTELGIGKIEDELFSTWNSGEYDTARELNDELYNAVYRRREDLTKRLREIEKNSFRKLIGRITGERKELREQAIKYAKRLDEYADISQKLASLVPNNNYKEGK